MDPSVYSSTDLFAILVAALAGVGISLLWMHALPLEPLRNWIVVRLSRLHDRLALRGLPRYPVWLLKGALSCGECLAPWAALVVALLLDLQWYALLAMPCSYALFIRKSP